MRRKLLSLVLFVIASAFLILPVSAQDSTAGVALRDAGEVALEIVGGAPIGGTVTIMGVLGGAEQDQFMSIFAPFETATGIDVQYESTGDLLAVLQTRVDAGTPPDVVSTPFVAQMIDFARAGHMVDISAIVDMEALSRDYDQGFIDTLRVGDGIYGLFDAVNVESLVWYNPNTYTGPNPPATWDELEAWARDTAASGTTPWCIGLESGSASGWPGVQWVTDIFIRQAGLEKYDQWRDGELPWTSPEVRQAFETFGSVATDPTMVNGGATAVLATAFQNGADGIFSDPPTCYLHRMSSFMGAIINGNFPNLTPVTDINFFPFPAMSEGSSGIIQLSGESMGVFNDTPQSRALIAYMATPEAQAILAGLGGWISSNKSVPLDAYPDPTIRQAAEAIQSASAVRYDMSALIPSTLSSAFTTAVLDYVQNPDQLDTILANLDTVRESAYSQ